MVKDFPDIRDDWDETYGDRCNELVFIGKGYEKSEIVKLLYGCMEKAGQMSYTGKMNMRWFCDTIHISL